MSNKFKNIDEALEVSSTPISNEIIKKPKKDAIKPDNKDDSDFDYEYTRGHLYSLIEKGQEAIDGIMELARETDSPRAYEVALQGIKNISDVTDKLADLQQKMKKLKEENARGPKNVTNALFVGSTAELQKLLKKGFDPEDISK
jgi:hypothetical protein